MPVEITCPHCKGQLRVPEELFGKRVQCPSCEAIFVADVEGRRPDKPAAGEPASDDLPMPPRSEPYDDDRVPSRYGRYLQPHRGGLIMGLGIASIASFAICPLISIFLGIPAWTMGNADLDAMRRGVMDRAGESNTQAGRICGMIATILMAVGCCGYAGFMALMGFRGNVRF